MKIIQFLIFLSFSFLMCSKSKLSIQSGNQDEHQAFRTAEFSTQMSLEELNVKLTTLFDDFVTNYESIEVFRQWENFMSTLAYSCLIEKFFDKCSAIMDHLYLLINKKIEENSIAIVNKPPIHRSILELVKLKYPKLLPLLLEINRNEEIEYKNRFIQNLSDFPSEETRKVLVKYLTITEYSSSNHYAVNLAAMACVKLKEKTCLRPIYEYIEIIKKAPIGDQMKKGTINTLNEHIKKINK